jgi:hypothetical protein
LAPPPLQEQAEGGGSETESGGFWDHAQTIDADVAEVGTGEGQVAERTGELRRDEQVGGAKIEGFIRGG